MQFIYRSRHYDCGCLLYTCNVESNVSNGHYSQLWNILAHMPSIPTTQAYVNSLARTKKKRSTEWKCVYCCVDWEPSMCSRRGANASDSVLGSSALP